METAYEKYMLENNVKYDELPQDAKIAIREVKKAVQVIDLCENTGKKVPKSALDKLKVMDKFALREVMDFVEGTNTAGDAPFKAEDVKDDIKDGGKKDDNTPDPGKKDDTKPEKKDDNVTDTANLPDPRGQKIDAELEKLFKEGKTTLTMAELKTLAPATEALIFDTYQAGTENGVETSYYKLIEGQKETFTLSKL